MPHAPSDGIRLHYEEAGAGHGAPKGARAAADEPA